MTAAEILSMLSGLDAILALGGKLVALAQQRHPELRAAPAASEREAIDAEIDRELDTGGRP